MWPLPGARLLPAAAPRTNQGLARGRGTGLLWLGGVCWCVGGQMVIRALDVSARGTPAGQWSGLRLAQPRAAGSLRA